MPLKRSLAVPFVAKEVCRRPCTFESELVLRAPCNPLPRRRHHGQATSKQRVACFFVSDEFRSRVCNNGLSSIREDRQSIPDPCRSDGYGDGLKSYGLAVMRS
jgi:hypothetical protein